MIQGLHADHVDSSGAYAQKFEVVNKAGRRSELAYQIAKRGAELKRDQEFTMLNSAVAAAGNTTTARTTASLQAFIKTNTDKQTNGVDPSYTTLPIKVR